MSHKLKVAIGLSSLIILNGCTHTAILPTVQVLPTNGKSFELFAQEDEYCRQYTNKSLEVVVDEVNKQVVTDALITTALGTGLGAAIGGNAKGAATGAATGAAVGTIAGAGSRSKNQKSIQEQFNNIYSACMYAKGNQIAQPAVNAVQSPVLMQQPPVVYTIPQQQNTQTYMSQPAPSVDTTGK
ncbi:MAG: glycine zipper family protein [Rhodospirillaceae bacterium]|jgi:hypothetical protein|nr:glycine zipper family protein [Rhodospirillaceae bacterium]